MEMTSTPSMDTSAQPGTDVGQQCSSCDESSARCWCVDCNEALCDACVSAHRRVTVTRSHRILNQPPTGGTTTPPTKFCRLHPSEPLKLFCFTCGQVTCRDCQLTAHMNHRYQFISEAVDTLKKQLEVLVQPIRAHRDTVRRSLQDMETRLQDIAQCESNLQAELKQSCNLLALCLSRRMEAILKEAKAVGESERDGIQRRMMKLKPLQQNRQEVIEVAEKAQNCSELSALLAYRALIESQLKNLPDQGLSPAPLMSQLKIITDKRSLDTLMNFGQLQVTWIPFSVSQTSNQNRDAAAATSSSSSLITTPPAPSCRSFPQTSTTDSPAPPVPVNCPFTSRSLSDQLTVQLSSSAPVTMPTAGTGTQAVKHPLSSAVKKMSLLAKNPRLVLLLTNQVQPVSAPVTGPMHPVSVGLPLSGGPPPVLNQLTVPHQDQLTVPHQDHQNQLTVTHQNHQDQLTVHHQNHQGQLTVPHQNQLTVHHQDQLTVPHQDQLTVPHQNHQNQLTVPYQNQLTVHHQDQLTVPHQNHQNQSMIPHQNPTTTCFAATNHTNSLCDLSTRPSSVSPVVRAMADSACDCSMEQVAVKRQEPAENEPTSTVSEEHEPTEKPSPPGNAEEWSSVIGHLDCSLSQWQPRVCLVRLPVTTPRPGCPPPAFRLVSGDDEDEIYLEELSEDSQSHVDDLTDDITELLSSPESPVTLQMVSCSACGSLYGSIICSACGRGYHRDCHVPPVGPDIRSELVCSLCQDLSDPSDPYSSDRPPRPQSPCLSLQDQRRCETLLLYLKVEGCQRLPQCVYSRLTLVSERLTHRRSPSYQTATEFLSDVWSLFRDASQDDVVLKEVQESFQSRLMDTLGSEAASSSTEGVEGHMTRSKVMSEEVRVKLSSTMKRLRKFLDRVGTSGSKRAKMDTLLENNFLWVQGEEVKCKRREGQKQGDDADHGNDLMFV